VFLQEALRWKGLSVEDEACDNCMLCRDVCPLGRPLPECLEDADGRCIQCLYCYSVCARKAIHFHGEFGFFSEQLRQYDPIIRKLYVEE
jgi:polyferredoxin